MSDLIAIAYPNEAAARRACTNLAAGGERRLLDVEDVLVITHDEDCRIRPLFDAWQVGFTGGVSVIAGGLVGTLLVGTLLVGPLLGILLGSALAVGPRRPTRRDFAKAAGSTVHGEQEA